MNDCVFCERRQAAGAEVVELPGVERFFFFWDVNPVTPGHLLVIPKRHVANFRELDTVERHALLDAVAEGYKLIESADLANLYSKLLKIFDKPKTQEFLSRAIAHLGERSGKPDGYNHGLNDGPVAGRTVHHLHYHIMPRWEGDTADPRGGIRHMFDGVGNYHQGVQQ